jgi:hypothetical protein
MSKHRQAPYTVEDIRTGEVFAEAESLDLLRYVPIEPTQIILKHYEPEQEVAA